MRYCILLLLSFFALSGNAITDPNKISLDDMFRCIEEVDNEYIASSDNSIILIGDTGSGKSTLANLLSGKQLKTYSPAGRTDLSINLKDPSNSITPIGHSASKSETDRFIPINIGNNETLWDCPGFGDRRGLLSELRNAFRMYKFITNAKHLKLVIVVEESSIDTSRANHLIDFFERLNNTLYLDEDDNKNSLKYCTTLIVTKVADFIPGEIQNAFINTLERNSACNFVSYLAENDHIACFCSPRQYGLKAGDEISNDIAGELMNVISKSRYASKVESRIVVSDKVIIALEETVNESMVLLNAATTDITHAITSSLENISMEYLKTVLGYMDETSKITDLKALTQNARDRKDFLALCKIIYQLNDFAKFLNSIRHIEERDEIFNEKIFMKNIVSILNNVCEMKEKDALIQEYEKFNDEIGNLWNSCKIIGKKFCRTFRFYRRCIKYGRKEALRREGIVSSKNKSIRNISEYYRKKEEELC